MKRVPVRFELRLEFLEVVNLAVKNNGNGAVFTGYRLVTTDEIDDREPSHSQCDTRFDHYSLIVGTAMPDDAAHAPEDRFTILQ